MIYSNDVLLHSPIIITLPQIVPFFLLLVHYVHHHIVVVFTILRLQFVELLLLCGMFAVFNWIDFLLIIKVHHLIRFPFLIIMVGSVLLVMIMICCRILQLIHSRTLVVLRMLVNTTVLLDCLRTFTEVMLLIFPHICLFL